MRRISRRFLLGPLLAVAATGAAVCLVVPVAEAATTASVRGGVNVRSGASSTAKVLSRLRDKQKISIACRVSGQHIRGPVRTTAQWDRLTSGGYVSHAYVLT